MKDWQPERIEAVNDRLEALLPAADTAPATLHEAMRYSVFAGGKRLRPLLCLAACEMLGGAQAACLTAACALELMHTFSLIHDDLPCMDDDALRRGKPTCHIAFGEALALLAGDALAILALETAARTEPPAPYTPAHVVRELAHATGHAGMVAGQVEDMAAERQPARQPARRLRSIHEKKTAAFVEAAVCIGGMFGAADARAMRELHAIGHALGLAFQIVDDILNVTGTPEQLGKAVGTDRQRGKLTYPAIHGLAASRRRARTLVNQALKRITPFGTRSEMLVSLARFVLERTR